VPGSTVPIRHPDEESSRHLTDLSRELVYVVGGPPFPNVFLT
jgi:hypothetical protein